LEETRDALYDAVIGGTYATVQIAGLTIFRSGFSAEIFQLPATGWADKQLKSGSFHGDLLPEHRPLVTV
jgi:hypothetical protein